MSLNLNDYAYVYFICEGTNEEATLNWIEQENRLCITNKEKYSKEFVRTAHTKQEKSYTKVFRDFNEFLSCCEKYKNQKKKQDSYFLIDIIKK